MCRDGTCHVWSIGVWFGQCIEVQELQGKAVLVHLLFATISTINNSPRLVLDRSLGLDAYSCLNVRTSERPNVRTSRVKMDADMLRKLRDAHYHELCLLETFAESAKGKRAVSYELQRRRLDAKYRVGITMSARRFPGVPMCAKCSDHSGGLCGTLYRLGDTVACASCNNFGEGMRTLLKEVQCEDDLPTANTEAKAEAKTKAKSDDDIESGSEPEPKPKPTGKPTDKKTFKTLPLRLKPVSKSKSKSNAATKRSRAVRDADELDSLSNTSAFSPIGAGSGVRGRGSVASDSDSDSDSDNEDERPAPPKKARTTKSDACKTAMASYNGHCDCDKCATKQDVRPGSPDIRPSSPGYSPTSPGFARTSPNSPTYERDSPFYHPGSPTYYDRQTPIYGGSYQDYSPTSPGYSPTSPGYSPTSPGYSPASSGYSPLMPGSPVGGYGTNSQGAHSPSPVTAPNSPVSNDEPSVSKATSKATSKTVAKTVDKPGDKPVDRPVRAKLDKLRASVGTDSDDDEDIAGVLDTLDE